MLVTCIWQAGPYLSCRRHDCEAGIWSPIGVSHHTGVCIVPWKQIRFSDTEDVGTNEGRSIDGKHIHAKPAWQLHVLALRADHVLSDEEEDIDNTSLKDWKHNMAWSDVAISLLTFVIYNYTCRKHNNVFIKGKMAKAFSEAILSVSLPCKDLWQHLSR